FNEAVYQLDPIFDVHVPPGSASISVKRQFCSGDSTGDFRFAHLADGREYFLGTGIDRLEGRIHRTGDLLAVDYAAERLAAVAAELGELLGGAEGSGGQGANFGSTGRHASGSWERERHEFEGRILRF